MADGKDVPQAEADGGSARAAETLSQFIARVLDQLYLSAWLPSAALVLLVAFVVQLGAVLDSEEPPDDPVEAIGRAFREMADRTVGGALMLAAAVVVLTMVTQAFSLAAIRLLEGYWGTNRAIEWVARHRCDHFRRLRRKLYKRRTRLTKKAVNRAIYKLGRKQQKQIARGGRPDFTAQMFAVLRAQALEQQTAIRLSRKEERLVNSTDWSDSAPADLYRRLVNVENRLADFPRPRRTLPTLLGNVMRKHEDDTKRKDVQSMVQEVYDFLPPSWQVEHDELRTRLELYCSMVVVIGAVSLFAVARLLTEGWYSLGAILVGLGGMWLALPRCRCDRAELWPVARTHQQVSGSLAVDLHHWL